MLLKAVRRFSHFLPLFALAPLAFAAGKFEAREYGGAKADGQPLDTAVSKLFKNVSFLTHERMSLS